MKQTYLLKNAITLNATSKKYNAVATPILSAEILKHKRHFSFDFSPLVEEFIVYKLTVENQPDIIQGMVAFRKTPGALECVNMETNMHNQGEKAIFNGVGKALVALCCKYSLDNGMDGSIFFNAKNRLMPYYARMGAIHIHGLCMALENPASKKMIDLYF